jgi:hypothetical protein
MPVPVPFEFALLPEGYVPVRVDEHSMEFVLSDDFGEDGDHVSVFIAARGLPEEPFGTPTTINGAPAQVRVDREDGVLIILAMSDDVTVTLMASAGLRLDESQAVRLAEGIAVTDYAVPLADQG